MALGGAPSGIFSLIVGEGLRLSRLGIVVGLFAAFELTRALQSMLVGVKSTDSVTFGLGHWLDSFDQISATADFYNFPG